MIGSVFTYAVFMEHFLPHRKMVKKEIEEALHARIEVRIKVVTGVALG